MASELKPIVPVDVFESLDIRLGIIQSVVLEPSAPCASYKLTIDFGKFGTRTSVARLTSHTPEELIGTRVFAVLNFEPRTVGNVKSEVLTLGVQYPKAASGEATIVSPAVDAKLGSKLF